MFINKYSKHRKNNKSSRKYFNKALLVTTLTDSANLFNLLYPYIITGGGLPLKQSEEERVINRITVNNPQLFTFRIEGDMSGQEIYLSMPKFSLNPLKTRSKIGHRRVLRERNESFSLFLCLVFMCMARADLWSLCALRYGSIRASSPSHTPTPTG